MDKSDFLTALFPADYGNVIGGVFDIRLRIGSNISLSGGKRFAVIDEEASYLAEEKIFDLEKSFREKGPLNYRIDLLISYTRQMKKREMNLRLDVKNVTNRTYTTAEDFDNDVGITQEKRGQILPVISVGFVFDWDKGVKKIKE